MTDNLVPPDAFIGRQAELEAELRQKVQAIEGQVSDLSHVELADWLLFGAAQLLRQVGPPNGWAAAAILEALQRLDECENG